MMALRFTSSHIITLSRTRKKEVLRGKRVGRLGNTRKKRLPTSKKLGTSTILLVDDKPEVRQMLRSILESESFACEEAENGAEALQCLDAQTFALVITDIEMPVMDGLELLQHLAQKPAGEPPIPNPPGPFRDGRAPVLPNRRRSRRGESIRPE